MSDTKKMVTVFSQEPFFTRWLSQHLGCLEKFTGKRIVNPKTECRHSEENGSGRYPADILAEYENGDRLIIENQYFLTNHVHLGEILTYAAWHNAREVFWIAERVDKEHFQAVKWLNRTTETSDTPFHITILLVPPLGDTPDDGISLREATDQDIPERPKNEFIPANADFNLLFWEQFRESFDRWFEGTPRNLSLKLTKRSDCCTLTCGERYRLNIPFRNTNFKVELVCGEELRSLYLAAMSQSIDLSQIRETLELTEFDTVEIPNIGPVLRVTCPAQVTNTEAWDEYIDKMLFIIDYLLRLGEQYKKCF